MALTPHRAGRVGGARRAAHTRHALRVVAVLAVIAGIALNLLVLAPAAYASILTGYFTPTGVGIAMSILGWCAAIGITRAVRDAMRRAFLSWRVR